MAKILIVRLGAMGDILHALPAVTSIRAALPDSTIGWLVEEKWTELLAAAGEPRGPAAISPRRPVVNRLHTVNTKRWRSHFLRSETRKEIWGAIRAIRNFQYDLALDFQGAVKSGFLASISSTKTRAGFVDPREPVARIFYSDKFSRHGEHVIEQDHAMAAEALGKYLGVTKMDLVAPQLPDDPRATAWTDAEIARLGLGSFAVMTPGAGWGAKQWPPQRFGEVAKALAVHGLKTLVNSAPGEESLAQAVVEAGGGHAFEIRCTIGQLIALTRRARLFLGGDTGPLHLAAALGVPVLGIFGPTDPARTGPFGTKAITLRNPESKTTFSHHRKPESGLLKITVEEAVSAARWLLGSGNG